MRCRPEIQKTTVVPQEQLVDKVVDVPVVMLMGRTVPTILKKSEMIE